MKGVTFLVKPASSLCDMRCRYCFYDDLSDHRLLKSMGRMSDETARRLIAAAFDAAAPDGLVHFLFQGGEPTLAGLAFFQTFLDLERRERRRAPSVRVSHAIQTNGMTLDEEWAALFAAHGFLVGLSLDGAPELHNRFRVDAAGRGSWNRVARSLSLLNRAGIETNLLCVVTGPLARHPQKVYQSLRRLGRPLQFIPCLDPLDLPRGSLPHSLTPEAYGGFLCGLFDCWYRDWSAGTYVSVRYFDDCLRLLMGLPPGSCAAAGACGGYLVVEGDGSLYPCDFYVLDRWRLGSIHRMSVGEALSSPLALAFRDEGARRPQACADCPYFPVCRGGCRRDWDRFGPEAVNYYCAAFRMFFGHALPRLREAARRSMGGG